MVDTDSSSYTPYPSSSDSMGYTDLSLFLWLCISFPVLLLPAPPAFHPHSPLLKSYSCHGASHMCPAMCALSSGKKKETYRECERSLFSTSRLPLNAASAYFFPPLLVVTGRPTGSSGRMNAAANYEFADNPKMKDFLCKVSLHSWLFESCPLEQQLFSSTSLSS